MRRCCAHRLALAPRRLMACPGPHAWHAALYLGRRAPQLIFSSHSHDAPRRISRRIIPRSLGPPMGDVRDICFSLVESRDLKMFTGTWRIEGNAKNARLLYNVEVQPQPWLPIGARRSTLRLVFSRTGLASSPLFIRKASCSNKRPGADRR